jgi:integrase
MQHENSFSVSRFKNRNGAFSFRVDGYLNGNRIRRNFKTREEAAAEQAALTIKALQLASNLRSVSTSLTEDQVREAEVAFRRIAECGRPLSFYVDFTLTNFREPASRKLIAEAVTEFEAAKRHEYQQDLLSKAYLRQLRCELQRLQSHFPTGTVEELTGPRLLGYFESGLPARKTFNNRRGVISAFLKYALQRDWILENPLVKIPAHRLRRSRCGARTLTAASAKELMAYVETQHSGCLVPFFALCLFAGIRPCVRTGEISRLKPEHVLLADAVVAIDGEVSKVREPRRIVIQPNLAAWLRAYPLTQFPIIPLNTQHLRARIAKKFELSHDIMRHTYISMFVAKFRSMGEAALQAGNSESIIRKHYLDLKSAAEAEQFFSILPKRRAALEPIPVAAARPVDAAA